MTNSALISALIYIFMATCLLQYFAESALECTEFVTTGAGEKTWQSSSFKEYTKGPFICGIGGSQLDGAFKSADEGSAADKGYHWLAVQLRSTVWTDGFVISPITSESQLAERIEVWTTTETIGFGSEKCNSRNMSSVFETNKKYWTFCGSSKPTAIQVNCSSVQEAKTVLLRKPAWNNKTNAIESMAFSILAYKYISIDITFDIAPPSNISSNTSAKVRCNVSCIDSLASIKLIHLSTNRTLATGNETYVIDSVNEEDYGVYACSVGGVVVSSGYLSVASKETKELQRPSSPELTQFYIYILMAVSSILLIAVVAGAIFACRKMAIGSHQTLERKLATVRHSTEKVSNEEPPTPDNGVAEGNSCTYASLMPSTAEPNSNEQRPESEVTEYLMIIKDGI